MSGYFIMHFDSLVAWSTFHQECTVCSSCQAKVYTTNKFTKTVLALCHLSKGLSLLNTFSLSPSFNNNQACMDWSKSITNEGMKPVTLCENAICENVALGKISFPHVSFKTNPANLFTKNFWDGVHFFLQELFMPPLR